MASDYDNGNGGKDQSPLQRRGLSTGERLAYIESDVHYMKRDIATIKNWVKWSAMAIMGVVLTAVVRFILAGGLNIPPPSQ